MDYDILIKGAKTRSSGEGTLDIADAYNPFERNNMLEVASRQPT